MKALVKAHEKPGLWMQDVPRPEPGPEDVLIKVNEVAICGTDLHIYNWDQWAQEHVPVPMTIGHEYIGVIEEIGELVHSVKVGDRVSGEGHIMCGECRNCRAGRGHLCRDTRGVGVNRPGAFAISDDIASILDPLGNAVHTALSFDLVGEDVLITGAGPIGLMATAVARHVGARHVVITDVNQKRLAMADQFGASRTVVAGKEDLHDVMEELGMLEGFDVGLEMSGNENALHDLIDIINHGGKIALLGIYPNIPQVNLNQAIFKGLSLKGIYGREMFETWHKMVAMLGSGLDVTAVITDHIDFDDFATGFSRLNAGEACKVVMRL
jgi:threonine 3-dehydrogenase